VPLDPRLTPIVALAERLGDDGATLPTRRLAGTVQARQFGRLLVRPGPEAATREIMVPVDGGAVRVRLYRPPVPRSPGPLPLHVFLHGGGWCVGDLDQRDPRCRTIAVEADCVVASVDYRMAPENAFPVPVEDCYAALCELVARADELRVDPTRVSVGGESAGANLAAVVALLARDRSGPPLVLQWLDVPATDLTLSQPSIDRLGTGYLLTRDDMEVYLAAYLRDADPKDPLASPLHAPDLAGLPPALVMVAELDPLRDDGLAYAERLRRAGVPVELHDLGGLVHAGFGFTRLLPTARRYEQDALAALRRAYAGA
jgi:acetyl esterase